MRIDKFSVFTSSNTIVDASFCGGCTGQLESTMGTAVSSATARDLSTVTMQLFNDGNCAQPMIPLSFYSNIAADRCIPDTLRLGGYMTWTKQGSSLLGSFYKERLLFLSSRLLSASVANSEWP